jgi:hypothetical protein
VSSFPVQGISPSSRILFFQKESPDEKPLVLVPALRRRLTGGASLPSRSHGVLSCFSSACPTLLSIRDLTLSSCSFRLFWFKDLIRAEDLPFLKEFGDENLRN